MCHVAPVLSKSTKSTETGVYGERQVVEKRPKRPDMPKSRHLLGPAQRLLPCHETLIAAVPSWSHLLPCGALPRGHKTGQKHMPAVGRSSTSPNEAIIPPLGPPELVCTGIQSPPEMALSRGQSGHQKTTPIHRGKTGDFFGQCTSL